VDFHGPLHMCPDNHVVGCNSSTADEQGHEHTRLSIQTPKMTRKDLKIKLAPVKLF
jgi:hypothetical protein